MGAQHIQQPIPKLRNSKTPNPELFLINQIDFDKTKINKEKNNACTTRSKWSKKDGICSLELVVESKIHLLQTLEMKMVFNAPTKRISSYIYQLANK